MADVMIYESLCKYVYKRYVYIKLDLYRQDCRIPTLQFQLQKQYKGILTQTYSIILKKFENKSIEVLKVIIQCIFSHYLQQQITPIPSFDGLQIC